MERENETTSDTPPITTNRTHTPIDPEANITRKSRACTVFNYEVLGTVLVKCGNGDKIMVQKNYLHPVNCNHAKINPLSNDIVSVKEKPTRVPKRLATGI